MEKFVWSVESWSWSKVNSFRVLLYHAYISSVPSPDVSVHSDEIEPVADFRITGAQKIRSSFAAGDSFDIRCLSRLHTDVSINVARCPERRFETLAGRIEHNFVEPARRQFVIPWVGCQGNFPQEQWVLYAFHADSCLGRQSLQCSSLSYPLWCPSRIHILGLSHRL